jgi:hypothetical protein
MPHSAKYSPTVHSSLSGAGYGDNPAVALCFKAWQRTYDLALCEPDDGRLAPENDNSNFFAREQAAIAFRDAMPPLCGRENIGNFVACATYAMLKQILSREECTHLFSAARIALSLLRLEPRAASSRSSKPEPE